MADIAAPLELCQTRIKPEWIDEYGHVNIAHYLTICDQANWAFWNMINEPSDMAAREGHEYVIVENHVHYLNELPLAASVRVTTRLLAMDDKRYILFHHVWRTDDDQLSATNEVKCLAFNLTARRSEIWQPDVRAQLEAIHSAHASLEPPPQAGLGIALARRS